MQQTAHPQAHAALLGPCWGRCGDVHREARRVPLLVLPQEVHWSLYRIAQYQVLAACIAEVQSNQPFHAQPSKGSAAGAVDVAAAAACNRYPLVGDEGEQGARWVAEYLLQLSARYPSDQDVARESLACQHRKRTLHCAESVQLR